MAKKTPYKVPRKSRIREDESFSPDIDLDKALGAPMKQMKHYREQMSKFMRKLKK